MRWFPARRLPTSGFSLFQKLLAVFLIAIIPVFIISTLLNRSGETSIREEITKSLKSNAHFYLSTFELEMGRVFRMKQQYILDNEVQNLMLFHMIYSDSDAIAAMQEIERRLQQFKDSSLFIDSISLLFPDLELTIQNNRIARSIDPDELAALQATGSFGNPIMPYGSELFAAESYPKRAAGGGTVKLWMKVSLSRANMERSLKEVASYNGGEALIVDHAGKWLLGDLPQEEMTYDGMLKLLRLDQPGGENGNSGGSGIGRFAIGDRSYVYAYESSAALDATLVAYVPESSFLGPIEWYNRLYMLLAATSLVVVLIVSLWIYSMVHKPMLRLTGAFRKLEKGSFNTHLAYDRKDEFRYLYQQFNQMSERLEQLINEAYEHEMRLNRAELKQLQAQINPHFLYNIFFLLNRIVKLEDIDNAKRLTKYLGQFFRFITRNKEDEALLKEEMSHIEAYAGIQSMRFGRKLSVDIRPLPEQAGELRVPRLILQPLVENAFEYGLEDHPEQGVLRVYGERREDGLALHIEDNGGALTDEALSRLSALLAEKGNAGETTGLLNIHRRLQLKFGPPYGLSVGRSALGGLHATVLLPLDGAEKGELRHEHIQAADRG